MSTASGSSPVAVRATGLAKDYFGVPALDPLDLTVPAGQRVTMVGHNGSGKTTLLRMLAATLEPSEGSAEIGGSPAGSPDARAAVSFLTDQPVFYDDLTVWEHLEYIARLHHTEEWEQHAIDLLDRLELVERADDLPSGFSRGLKQKAAIALALVRPFDVLLVDEPFVGLDRSGREALLGLLADVHTDGATLMVATHDLSSVGHAERLIALRAGRVAYDGAPDAPDVDELVERDAGGDPPQ